jgi:hypothetical protein
MGPPYNVGPLVGERVLLKKLGPVVVLLAVAACSASTAPPALSSIAGTWAASGVTMALADSSGIVTGNGNEFTGDGVINFKVTGTYQPPQIRLAWTIPGITLGTFVGRAINASEIRLIGDDSSPGDSVNYLRQ